MENGMLRVGATSLGLLILGGLGSLGGTGGMGCANPVSMAQPDLGPPDLLDCNATPAACGGCLVDKDCMDPSKSRCDPRKHVCIECLPAGDNCPKGQACVPYSDGYACSKACLVNAECNKIASGGACCFGACHDTSLDTQACGGCGIVCADVVNGSSVCAKGACAIGLCNAGHADCDLSLVTGCEVDITTDVSNCGACNTACGLSPNSNAICKAGQCSTACKPGFGDCNQKIADGCEVDLTFDTKNCGACGTISPPAANATAFCDNGKPTFRCKGHFFDCNMDAKDGCELDASTDPNNCGHCKNACPTYANASPGCVAGACIAACNNGYFDCDKNAMNGCETVTSNDLKNCGGCGLVCSNINAVPICQAGVCTLTCNAGYTDCNMLGADGCEANVKFDAMNCGACGNVCPMNTPYCVGGKCTNINTKVMIIGAEDPTYTKDVADQVKGTGAFTGVDTFDARNGTPSLVQLKAYGAVLVFSDYGFADATAMGDVLADYFDGGGSVVISSFTNCQDAPLYGRFGDESKGYMMISAADYCNYQGDSLGTIKDPQSPLIAGVKVFAAQSGYQSNGAVINGGIVVAEWAGGYPLVVRGTVKGRNIAALNMFPPSAKGGYNDWWTGDGANLMRNALLYR